MTGSKGGFGIFKRGSKAQTPAASTPNRVATDAEAPAQARVLALLTPPLAPANPFDWVGARGDAPAGSFTSMGYVATANQGIRSVESIAAEPGSIYELEVIANPERDATNGVQLNYFAGPMFLDAAGNVLFWWLEQEALSAATGGRRVTAHATAPDAARTVHISFHGAWQKSGVPSDGLVRFSNAVLRKR